MGNRLGIGRISSWSAARRFALLFGPFAVLLAIASVVVGFAVNERETTAMRMGQRMQVELAVANIDITLGNFLRNAQGLVSDLAFERYVGSGTSGDRMDAEDSLNSALQRGQRYVSLEWVDENARSRLRIEKRNGIVRRVSVPGRVEISRSPALAAILSGSRASVEIGRYEGQTFDAGEGATPAAGPAASAIDGGGTGGTGGPGGLQSGALIRPVQIAVRVRDRREQPRGALVATLEPGVLTSTLNLGNSLSRQKDADSSPMPRKPSAVSAADPQAGALMMLDEQGQLYGQGRLRSDGAVEMPSTRFAERHPRLWEQIRGVESGHLTNRDGAWMWSTAHAWLGESTEPSWVILSHVPAERVNATRARVWSFVLLFLLPLLAISAALAWKLSQMAGELLEATRNAEQANEAKGRFLANMSHEIRTPLNAILGMAYILGNEKLNPEQQMMVHRVRVAARSLLSIINDLLDLTKIEAGKFELSPFSFRLSEVLGKVGSIMSVNAGDKALELVISEPQSDDGERGSLDQLIGDATRLEQILVNLTGNAIKFTQAGSVMLAVERIDEPPWASNASAEAAQASRAASGRTEREDAAAAGEREADLPFAKEDRVWLRFTVTDTGIGIAAERQPQLFGAFQQGDASISRRFGGTGLGLNISRHLALLMGGRIEFRSEEGKGSCFWVDLPFQRDRQSVGLSTTRPLSVLVADDHPAALMAATYAVRSMGWRVDTAATGDEAIERARQRNLRAEPYDVLLLDWRMPGVDGLVASRAIRDLPGWQRDPMVILMTGYDRSDLSRRSNNEEVDATLSKPVTSSMLYDAVSSVAAERGEPGLSDPAEEASTGDRRRLQGIKVLVVDDSLINLEVAQRILQSEGAIVEVARDGQECLTHFQSGESAFDCVLMDVQMPGMDGLEATRRLRAMTALRSVPIVALTAGAMKSQRIEAREAGMNDFVAKPFEVDKLVGVVRQWGRWWMRVKAQAQTQAQVQTQEQTPALDEGTAASAGDSGATGTHTEVGASTSAEQSEGGKVPRDWPALEGADRLRSWQVVSGDRALLSKVLTRLREQFADAGDQLRSDLRCGDVPSAVRRLHSLRGAVGNVGALELARLTAELEHQIDESRDPSSDRPAPTRARNHAIAAQVESKVAAIELQLTRLLRSARALTADRMPVASDEGAADSAAMPWDQEAFSALCSALEKRGLSAIAQYRTLKPALADRLDRGTVHRLDSAIDRLQFDVALSLLAPLREQGPMPAPGGRE